MLTLKIPRIFSLLAIIFYLNLGLIAPSAVNADAFGDAEPLDPDQAFIFTGSVVDNHQLRLHWQIADAYYMYRNKFKFSTPTPGVTLGTPLYPKGKMKQDDTFGNVEAYYKTVAIMLPIVRNNNNALTLEIHTVAQGCLDKVLCYSPFNQKIKLSLPAIVGATTSPGSDVTANTSPLNSLTQLGKKLGLINDQPVFLNPEQAFIFSAQVVDGHTLKASWDIAEGYYLYREKFNFELTQAGDGVRLKPAIFPPGQTKVDESFGKMEVYHKRVEVLLPLERLNTQAQSVELKVGYQGCADKGFCYPPIKAQTLLSLPISTLGSAPMNTLATSTAKGADTLSGAPATEDSQFANLLKEGNWWLIALGFYVGGLLLAFTPCVYPMIPILSSIIVGQGAQATPRRAFVLSLIYVLSMALTYTIAGIIAGYTGRNLAADFQNPWVIFPFVSIFVVLSLSMFGFYNLQIPSRWQSKLAELSNRQQGGHLFGVGIMGMLSALIVGPCVAAPIIGALVYISNAQDPVLGGYALFMLSLGMGTPLLLIGTGAGHFLPKAGHWMDTVKAVFGVLLLAVAIWLVERVVPISVTMSLWAILLICSAIYMGALDSLAPDVSGWRRLWKGVGLMMLIYGVFILAGVAMGNKSVLQPLAVTAFNTPFSGSGNADTRTNHALNFRTIKGLEQLQTALTQATTAGKPVMVDVYADWCIACKELEEFTFADPQVKNALRDVVLLRIDVTANDADDQAFLKHYRLFGPPTVLFFDRQGQERREVRLVGFVKPEKFLELVNHAYTPG